MWARPISWKSQTSSNFQFNCVFDILSMLLFTLNNLSPFFNICFPNSCIYSLNLHLSSTKELLRSFRKAGVTMKFSVLHLSWVWGHLSFFAMNHRNYILLNENKPEIYTRSILNTLQCYWAFSLEPEADVDNVMLIPREFVYGSHPIDLSRC